MRSLCLPGGVQSASTVLKGGDDVDMSGPTHFRSVGVCVLRESGVRRSGASYIATAQDLLFAVLIPLSLCSYHYFERPCQPLLQGMVDS